MKKYLNYFLIFALVPVLVLSSCKKTDDDNDDPTVEKGDYTDLKNYMVGAGLDLTDVLVDGWVIAPKLTTDGGIVTPVANEIPTYNVFDIRSAEDFNAGHVPGSVNVPLVDVVTTAVDYHNKPILVVCKSGQTAGHAVMALRLSGHSDAAVMKFGMAGWNAEFEAAWVNNIGNTHEENGSEWITEASPDLGTFAIPSWESTATEGGAILAERVQLMLDNGFKTMASDDVWGNQDNYQIHNFWAEADYTDFGHFSTAIQYKPIAFDNVEAVDSEEATLIYCFTGQTSSMVTAWLNVLGYDAKSVLFGVNRINYDGLEAAGKPHWHGSADFVFDSK